MIRSVALGRKIATGIFLAFIGFLLLSAILSLGFGLELIVEKEIGTQDVVGYLNTYLFFFFLSEMLYRMMLQKVSAMELEHYLHLPIKRSKIIHFVLITSFVSALNLVPIFLFAPFAFTQLSGVLGVKSALFWLGTIVGISWSLHWFILWVKHKFGNNLWFIIGFFIVIIGTFTAAYYQIFNIGIVLEPFMAASSQSVFPFLSTVVLGISGYYLSFNHYRKHAYIEDFEQQEKKSGRTSPSLFGDFGLAGELADQELKLILRHKKSRTYLWISLLFVAYGLWVYTDADMIGDEVISFLTIFIGIFITGSFLINYGQFFLSWNSPYFDFFLVRKEGIRSLVQGKYLIFLSVSLLCFILCIPYVYFAWESLLINLACFLFNIGINVHIIMLMGLWKPQPINLQEGNIFSMDGMGAAQFLMGIPIILFPYIVYLPFSLLASAEVGLAAIGITGIFGLLFYEPFIELHTKRLQKKRYNIAASFRQEL